MHRHTRLVVISALALIVIGALLWTALRPVPATVETAAVIRAPMEVTVDVDGTTRIREVYEVSAPMSGIAKRSPVRVGDPVAQGVTLVAEVEPVAPSLLDARSRSQAEAAVHEAEAALEVAEANVRQAQEDMVLARQQFDRTTTLVDRGVESLARMETVAQTLKVKEAAHAAAVSARDVAQGALERARAALIGPDMNEATQSACCVQITAPADGVVLSIDRISERPVAAGERLLSIGDPTDLEIVADPLSRDAVQIPENALAHVERWGGPGTLTARLRRINPSAETEVSALGIEEQRVEAIFDLVDPPEARPGLGDGYAVVMRIVTWQSDDALQLPLGALFRQNGDWAVYVDRDGTARLQSVEIGRQNSATAQVLSGLAEGDRVILHPGSDVAEGVPLEPAVRD